MGGGWGCSLGVEDLLSKSHFSITIENPQRVLLWWISLDFDELSKRHFQCHASKAEFLNDPTSLQPLPLNILTMKSKIVSPPPGEYCMSDIYCTGLWQHIQHIVNEFWFTGRQRTYNLWKNARNGKARKGISKLAILPLLIKRMF